MHARPLTFAGARGALLAAAPGPMALLGWWRHARIAEAGLEAVVPAALAALAFALAAWQLGRRPRTASALVGLALLSMLGVALPALVVSPAMALLLAIVAIGAWLALRRVVAPPTGNGRAPAPNEDSLPSHTARGAAASALTLWLMSTLAGALRADDDFGLLALGVSLGIACALTLAWTFRASAAQRRRKLVLWGAGGALLLLAALLWGDWPRLESLAAIYLVVALFTLPRMRVESQSDWWDPILGHPERLFVATFAVLCTLGTLLLAMPESSASGHALAIDDAAFTAVSAVCVTGLTVVDTGTTFSPLGQVFVLLLIQAGGLGIMTFSTAAMRLLGRRMSMRHEGIMARLVSPQDRSQVFSATARLVMFTFTVEAIGAFLLWIAFMADGGEILASLWRALFTAISAFCNAGFALWSDNLVGLQTHPFILHVVALLIILGGLAPAVVIGLPRFFKSPHGTPPQVQIVLATTGALLLIGFGAFLALEWSRSLAGLDVADKLHNAWFQSVTLRTAGFNSIDYGGLQTTTLLVMMVMMFIGGSPGGTAGGIKTTTVGLLALAVVAAVRGKSEIVTRGRRISHRSIYKAAAVTTAGFGTVFIGLVLVLLTQDMPVRTAAFEVVSAVGTVGLSIGGTAQLDEVGKGIIMTCMFLGRVGSLTLLMFLSQRGGEAPDWKRPEVDIEVA